MRIELFSTDHHLADRATRKIVESISERHARTPIAIPLPAESTEDEDGFIESRHRRAIKVWSANSDLIQHLTQVQLPEGIDVQIREA